MGIASSNGNICAIAMDEIRAAEAYIRQKALTPDHGIPAIAGISQTDTEVMIKRATLGADTKADIAYALVVCSLRHFAPRKRNCAGTAPVGVLVERPGIVMTASNGLDNVGDQLGRIDISALNQHVCSNIGVCHYFSLLFDFFDAAASTVTERKYMESVNFEFYFFDVVFCFALQISFDHSLTEHIVFTVPIVAKEVRTPS